MVKGKKFKDYVDTGSPITQVKIYTSQYTDELMFIDIQATLKSRKIRSEFLTEAGSAGLAISGSTEALLANYYRTEGNYRNALRNNMDINISQFERNLEAIQFGQESQMTYEVPPNHNLLFATQALNVANTYYSLEVAKEMRGLLTDKKKRHHSL